MSELCLGNCEGCNTVQDLISANERLRTFSGALGTHAVGSELDDEIAPAVFDHMEALRASLELPYGIEEIGSPQELASQMRKSVAKTLDDVDTAITDNGHAIEELTRGCLGPLKMREQKAGRTLTVTVCNSPLHADGETVESVELKRSWG